MGDPSQSTWPQVWPAVEQHCPLQAQLTQDRGPQARGGWTGGPPAGAAPSPSPSCPQECSGPTQPSKSRGAEGLGLTSPQETPPGTVRPAGTKGRGLRCPAGPTSAPGGFCTEDSPSVTPSTPGCFFLPRTSGKQEVYCQGLKGAWARATPCLTELLGHRARRQRDRQGTCVSLCAAPSRRLSARHSSPGFSADGSWSGLARHKN